MHAQCPSHWLSIIRFLPLKKKIFFVDVEKNDYFTTVTRVGVGAGLGNSSPLNAGLGANLISPTNLGWGRDEYYETGVGGRYVKTRPQPVGAMSII